MKRDNCNRYSWCNSPFFVNEHSTQSLEIEPKIAVLADEYVSTVVDENARVGTESICIVRTTGGETTIFDHLATTSHLSFVGGKVSVSFE